MRIIANVLLFLFLTVNAYAGGAMGLMMAGGSAAAAPAGCTTVQTPTETGATTTTYYNASATTQNHATRFLAQASNTICAIDVYLVKQGNPSGTMNVTVQLYSDDGGGTPLPNASLGTSTTTILATNLGAEAAVKFEGLNVALTSGVYYWVAVFSNEYHATDNFGWGAESGGTTEVVAQHTPWAQISTARTGKYVLYTSP